MGSAIKYLFVSLAALFIVWVSYYYVRVIYFVNTFEYGYKIKGIDLGQLKDLIRIGTNQSQVGINFLLTVKNTTNYTILLKGLRVELYYMNLYVGRTEEVGQVKVVKHGTTNVDGTFRLINNKATLALAENILRGEKVKLEYVVNFSLFSLPFTFKYKGTYEYQMGV